MDRLRLPFFIVAAICLVLAVALESGANLCGSLLGRVFDRQPGAPAGLGIPYLALLDGLLVFTIALMGLALLVPDRIHAKLQGIATLVVSFLVVLGGIAMALVAFALLMVMVGLFLAVPFGTIAYLAIFGDFDTGSAQALLAMILALKLAGGICLALAHQRFLQNKGLVLIVLTSLLANLVVGFLQNLVPTPLVSITDAIAAIVVAIIALIWAVVLLIASLPAIVKAVNVTKGLG
jgi:hypothetical protein